MQTIKQYNCTRIGVQLGMDVTLVAIGVSTFPSSSLGYKSWMAFTTIGDIFSSANFLLLLAWNVSTVLFQPSLQVFSKYQELAQGR